MRSFVNVTSSAAIEGTASRAALIGGPVLQPTQTTATHTIDQAVGATLSRRRQLCPIQDITLRELRIECFHPVNESTRFSEADLSPRLRLFVRIIMFCLNNHLNNQRRRP